MKRQLCVLAIITIMLMLHKPAQASVVTSPFGWRVHPVSGEWQFHTGVDIAEDFGCGIPALLDGQVVFADAYAGYGNTVLISHENNIFTLYAHCDRIYAKPGQMVAAGGIIATVGSTGLSTGPHLHLELWVDGQYADPMSLLDAEQEPQYEQTGGIRF